MCWTNVDNKHKSKYDRGFVLCEEAIERAFIIKTILEEFPYLSSEQVENAVDYCTDSLPRPRPSTVFFRYIEKQLTSYSKPS